MAFAKQARGAVSTSEQSLYATQPTMCPNKVQSHRSLGAQCRVHADEEHSASLGFTRHAFPSRKQRHSIGPNDGHFRDHESRIRWSNRITRIGEDSLSTGGRRVTTSLSSPPSPSPSLTLKRPRHAIHRRNQTVRQWIHSGENPSDENGHTVSICIGTPEQTGPVKSGRCSRTTLPLL